MRYKEGMILAVERLDARAWSDEQLEPLFGGAFPGFITADQGVKEYIGRVRAWFPELNIILIDAGDVPVATGWGVPIRWSGDSPARTGQGGAAELITALRELATTAGWPRVIAPVRPTLKPRYPLTPIEEFARWTRPDGAPLDPWLRTHWRLGGRIIATAPQSQTMTGTVEEWQAWTGMVFPSTGDYVIPDGLSTLHIDREADSGTYTEPNVWVQHR